MSVFSLRKKVAAAFLTCGLFLPALLQGQVVSIIAGLGKASPVDGASALNTTISGINGVAMTPDGDIYFTALNAVRKITANGILETVAGAAAAGRTGDGGPASAARLSGPTGLALDKHGNLYISDTKNSCVRKIDTKGIITTVAGMGTGYSDDTLAIHAKMEQPGALALDDAGNLYIADISATNGKSLIRKVGTDGYIHTIAGSKTNPKYLAGFKISGVKARDCGLASIDGIQVKKNGDVIFSDRSTCIVRRIGADSNVYDYAGSWKYGVNGDESPATTVTLGNPMGLTKDKDDNIYIAESDGGRIRKVDANGVITTIAGAPGSNVKSGKALDVGLTPQYISTDANGNMVIVQRTVYVAYYAPKFGNSEDKMLVFPNPCQRYTNVVLPSTYAETATVFAIDVSGRVVATSTGTTNRNISLYFKEAGVYAIYGTSAHGSWSGKVSVAQGN
jgi:sugar lactone lactonase YvrE